MPNNPVIIGDCTLYLGDCLEVFPTLVAGSVDVVVTDPPYGVGDGTGGMLHDYSKSNYSGQWKDDRNYIEAVCVPAVNICRQIARCTVLTPGTKHLMCYPQPDDIGAFWTPSAASLSKWGFTSFHPILYYGKYWRAGRGNWPNGTTMNERAEQNGHPCPKPIKAWTWLVEKASRGSDVIFDPFMGSGTTGVVCVQTGRKFIGIEIDPRYFDIACKRIAECQGKGSLFDPEAMESA